MRGPARSRRGRPASERSVRRYTLAVRWMKVILPLGAVALIAAIFVSARNDTDLSALFTPEELARLGAGLKLEHPRFAGMTRKGEPFAVRADWAVPDSAMPDFIDLEHPEGEIEMAGGRTISARAAAGRLMRRDKSLTLQGGVAVDTSDGYHIETELFEVDLDGKSAVAPGPVKGSGPRGTIEAGSFRALSSGRELGSGQIWFENRVRLVFIPASGPE